jgi:hypothetical protein
LLRNWRARRLSVVLLCAVCAAGCGPELTDAGTVNLTGHWVAQTPVGVLTEIQLDLTQAADGSLEGTWSGKSSRPNAPCPPDLGETPTNTASGRNTALEVDFELLGAGHFDGQITTLTTLTGSVLSCGTLYPVVFVRTTAPVKNTLHG